MLQSRVRISGEYGSVKGPVEFMIDYTYIIRDMGPIVEGSMIAGTVKIGDTLKLGPNKKDNSFKLVYVTGIEFKRVRVEETVAG